MTKIEQKQRAKEFAGNWNTKTEAGNSNIEEVGSPAFWTLLLRDVYGIEHAENFISFGVMSPVGMLDAYLSRARIIIEFGERKTEKASFYKRSDEFCQKIREKIGEFSDDMIPRYLVSCDYETFLVYDLEQADVIPEEIRLEHLETEFERLAFLAGEET